jgi:NhaA family Na+:H+ antiporter
MVARLIFGAGHAAIPFLLLLAIADDAIGLLIIAVVYPQEEVRPSFLLLAVAGVLLSLVMRRLRWRSFWPYLMIAGSLSWVGFALAGLHPALGLLPIIPAMPHAHVDTGLFDWSRIEVDDTLTRFEHWWKNPVELILGAFGLLNAGVVFSAVGPATYLVLAGLLIGKPLGIWGFGLFAAKGLNFGMPRGLRTRDLVIIGFAAGIGFTVALFVASVAFPAGPAQDAAKMGALASFIAAALTWLAARMIGVTKVPAVENSTGAH